MEEQVTFSQALEKLPDGITFPSKLSYDKENKTIILAGQLTEDERDALLRMSPDPLYSHAIEQLYRMSQLPDTLVWKEPTDTHFVTEAIAPMTWPRYLLLTAWLILVGAISMWSLFSLWPPPSSSSTQEVKSKLDSVLVVQKKKIDSLQALSPTSSTKLGPGAQPATTAVRGTKSDTTNARKAVVDTAKTAAAHKDSTTSLAHSIFGEPGHELQYLLLALWAGILGGASRSLSSLVMYRASRKLFKSWTLWYFSQPVLGGMFAVIGLALLKAGLIGNSGVETFNPAGIVAFSAMIGLFIDEFTNKLSEVFKTLFATKGMPPTDGKIGAKTPEVPTKK